jgi:divalent metal cation (Fe/Co/Zn/Cd) transporter
MTLLAQGNYSRASLERLAVILALATVAWNVVEGVIAIATGVESESIALVGFGLDSFIEVFAAGVIVWRLTANHASHEQAERRAITLIGVSFILLGTYVAVQATFNLLAREEPEASLPGILLATASLIVMPGLAWAKRSVADALSSHSLRAESTQTLVCACLSVLLVIGLLLNAAFGIWWADPVAALAMAPLIIREGWVTISKRDVCC